MSKGSFRGLIGVGRADITPPVGIYARNWGAAKQDVCTGIHRSLTASAVAFRGQDEGSPLVIVGLDLGWWGTVWTEREFRDGILRELGLAEERLLINVAHTHAGPGISLENSDKPGGELIAGYLEELQAAVVTAARSAIETARPGIAEWRYGRCDLAANRDLRDPERPRFVCGYAPGKPADDTLLVGRLTADDGEPIGTIVNYACHPTTLAWENELISPDYVGAMREVVESETRVPCLFLQGASGDLAPRNQYTGDVQVADRNGRHLGYAVLATLEGMTTAGLTLEFHGVVESGAPLAVWREMPDSEISEKLEARRVDFRLMLKEMPSAAELEIEMESCSDRVLAERLRRKMFIRRGVGDGTESEEVLWVWSVGEAVFLAQRNEAYSQFQERVRSIPGDRPVVVMNLTNGSMGYLPPAHLYDEDIYSVWQTPYERGGAEKLEAIAQKALENI